MAEPFLLGANYWPRRKAMSWWSEFELAEVRDDFDLVAGLGLRSLRIFLLWDDFQPTPSTVSTTALDHLRAVVDAAAERGLELNITFFTGHMSGPNWAPRWLLDGVARGPGERQVVSGGRLVSEGFRNPYVDPVALDAQRLLLRTVVAMLSDHPATILWNLGNEPDIFARPPDAAAGPAWARAMTDAIREVDDRRPITCGLHIASLTSDNGLRVDRIFETCDVAVMHAYPVYATWAAGPLDPDFMAFTCALTASLSGRPILAEEFGACTAPPGEPTQTLAWDVRGTERRQVMLAEEDLAEHLEAVLPQLVAAGAIGGLVWCFADYHPSLWDRPPCDDQHHERFFGLVRPDGSLKPHAEVLRRFAAAGPQVQDPAPRYRLSVDADAFYADPRANVEALYRAFKERPR